MILRALWTARLPTWCTVYPVTSVQNSKYVGETEKTLAVRFAQHRGYARNKKLDKATGHHFNLPGHSMANMKVTILEKVKSNDPQMRKTRESLKIKKFNSKYKGMNQKL